MNFKKIYEASLAGPDFKNLHQFTKGEKEMAKEIAPKVLDIVRKWYSGEYGISGKRNSLSYNIIYAESTFRQLIQDYYGIYTKPERWNNPDRYFTFLSECVSEYLGFNPDEINWENKDEISDLI